MLRPGPGPIPTPRELASSLCPPQWAPSPHTAPTSAEPLSKFAGSTASQTSAPFVPVSTVIFVGLSVRLLC